MIGKFFEDKKVAFYFLVHSRRICISLVFFEKRKKLKTIWKVESLYTTIEMQSVKVERCKSGLILELFYSLSFIMLTAVSAAETKVSIVKHKKAN